MVTKPSAGMMTPQERPRASAVTLREVAERAGVSLGAASSVLSGGNSNIRVAAETQSRVLEAAQALGYRSRRTSVVRSPRSSVDAPITISSNSPGSVPGTISIGIITSFKPVNTSDGSTQYDPWEHDITAGLEIALNEGASQIVTHYCNRGRTGELPMPVEEAIAQTIAHGVDALALIEISSSPQVVGRYVPLLMATKLPYVIVSSGVLSAPAANVTFDNFNAGYLAARHLIDQGYSEITFLSPEKAPWADERIAGAREALVHAGSPAALRVFPSEEEREPLPSFEVRSHRWDFMASARMASERLLSGRAHEMPTAVIGANDGTAIGFLEAAKNYGLHAGTDYAIMGFDDSPEARQHSLTTIRPPREGMGREAARLLLRLTSGDESARVQVRLNSHLMARRSTPRRTALVAPNTTSTPHAQEPSMSPNPASISVLSAAQAKELK